MQDARPLGRLHAARAAQQQRIVEQQPQPLERVAERPHVDLTVRAGGPRETLQRLADDDLDLAVGVFPRVPAGLASRELYRDSLVCIADPGHPRLRRGRMTAEAYLASPHVTVAPNRDTGIQLDEILEAMGIDRRVVMAVPHYLSVPALIQGTDMVGHIARRLVSVLRLEQRLAVFPVPLPIQIPDLAFVQVWHPRSGGDQGQRWFRDLVLDLLGPAGRPGRRAAGAAAHR